MTNHKKWEHEMPTEFSGMMDGIRLEPIPGASLERSLRAAEAIVMTKAARKRGRTNAVIVLMMLWPVIYLVALAVSHQFNISMTFAILGTSLSLSAIMIPITFGTMLLGRARAGQVLLDCGPHPARKQFWMMAALMFAAAFVTALLTTGIVANLIAIFLAAFALYWAVLSRGRLQICENGVYQYWGLLRWNRIQSYRWEGDLDATLLLQATTRFAFMGRGALPVAVEQKKLVDALLQKHSIRNN